MPVNYSLILDSELNKIASSGKTPGLLLHGCCAPCGSYVVEYLSRFFDIAVHYYNPNIYPREEFDKRAAELNKLLTLADYEKSVKMVVGRYDAELFETAAEPLRDEPEGGKRCGICFRIRLRETARLAREEGFDYFSTTLSVSPHKDASLLNAIGGELAKEFGIKYLYSDFKKKDGYKRSIELSKQYGLYRQTYCGCKYSYASSE